MDIKSYKGIPLELENFMEERYHSSYTTREYYRIFKNFENFQSSTLSTDGVLQDVFVYEIENDICTIHNRVTDIPSDSINTFTQYIFNKEKRVKEIIVHDILNQYNFPTAICYSKQIDVCINLPKTTKEYDALIGSKARREYERYERKLSQDFDDIRIVFNEKIGNENRSIIQDLSTLKSERFKQLNKKNSFEQEQAHRVSRYAMKYGYIWYVKRGEKTIGGLLCYKVKDELFAIVISFDISYYKYAVARILFYNAIKDAIGEGYHKFHFLWGGAEYIRYYRGDDIVLYTTHFFRTKAWRYLSRKIGVKLLLIRLELKANKRARKIYKTLKF